MTGTAFISYHTGSNKRHGSSSIWIEGHPRGTHTGQNYLTSSIQQTALQTIHSPTFWGHVDFSGFSLERGEHAQGFLIRWRSSFSRSKCAYTKKALSVLSCWAWLKRGREKKQEKLSFVLKNVRAANQNTVVKDCCSPPTTSLSEWKTDVPFASELCFFSPKSPGRMLFPPNSEVLPSIFPGCRQARLQQTLGSIWCVY